MAELHLYVRDSDANPITRAQADALAAEMVDGPADEVRVVFRRVRDDALDPGEMFATWIEDDDDDHVPVEFVPSSIANTSGGRAWAKGVLAPADRTADDRPRARRRANARQLRGNQREQARARRRDRPGRPARGRALP